MPIKVRLRDSLGKDLEMLLDPENTLHRLLPAAEDHSFDLLNTIDWYDVTEIPSRDMKKFLAELDQISPRVCTPEDRAYLDKLRALAEKCAVDTTHKLRFVGD